jgi:hypothetical protein
MAKAEKADVADESPVVKKMIKNAILAKAEKPPMKRYKINCIGKGAL